MPRADAQRAKGGQQVRDLNQALNVWGRNYDILHPSRTYVAHVFDRGTYFCCGLDADPDLLAHLRTPSGTRVEVVYSKIDPNRCVEGNGEDGMMKQTTRKVPSIFCYLTLLCKSQSI